MENEETPEPENEVEAPEIDPDDQEFDPDDDGLADDPEINSDDLLAARGGEKRFTRRDLSHPEFGAKAQTHLRHVAKLRGTLRERETALTQRQQTLDAMEAKIKADQAKWATTIRDQLRGTGSKGDPKATAGAGAKATPAAVGKGAQAPNAEAKGWAPPQTQEEFDALLEQRTTAQLEKLFGGFAEKEDQAAQEAQKQAEAGQRKTAADKHNAFMATVYAKAKNPDTKAAIEAGNKLSPQLWHAGFAPEMQQRPEWYAEFCLSIARHPQVQPLLNVFASIPREKLYGRKPAEVVKSLENTAREFGLLPEPDKTQVPADVLKNRRTAGRRVDGAMTLDELLEKEKSDPQGFLRELGENPAYSDMILEHRERASNTARR